MSKYYLKCHELFALRIAILKEQVRKLRSTLSPDEFVQHETVKLAARIRRATLEIIPEDPNRPEYLLSGDLKKFRRYKQGLQRYRLMFCFSNAPGIIIYLYVNGKDHLRKQGDRDVPLSFILPNP
jgi:mRNA-degrading endonuclease RelE of RelBE toxin-antitoxin system